jgi:hypothetical protein
MCKHVWLTTDHTHICSQCGLEEVYLSVDKYNKFSAPLNRSYNRLTRFCTKLDKLLAIHSGPRATDPVWSFIHSSCKKHFTPKDIRHALRRSDLKLKHYDSIRIFSDAFTNFKIRPFNVHTLRDVLIVKFNFIHRRWKVANIKQFFSYDFLIRMFLEDINSQLLIYLKPSSNKQRLRKYHEKLNSILTRNGGRKWNHDSGDIHSPND